MHVLHGNNVRPHPLTRPPTSSVSCSRVAAAPVGLLGEQKKMMSVRGTCGQG